MSAGRLQPEVAAISTPQADVAQRVRQAAFRHLLTGNPATAADLAGRAAIPEPVAAEAIATLVAARRAVTDGSGRVIGAAGLSIEETAHQLRIHGGAELWCWCAWDALGITSALRLTADAVTRCGSCGGPLTVTIVNGRLAASRTEYGYRPVPAGRPLSCFCPYALLFCSAEHLRPWQATLPAGVTGEGMPVTRYATAARDGWSWAAAEAPGS